MFVHRRFATGYISIGAIKGRPNRRSYRSDKIQSINNRRIIAVFADFEAKDISGSPLDGVENFQYLDINVKRDEYFGSKTAVNLPDSRTRQFTVNVKRVVFSDNSAWEVSADAIWEPVVIKPIVSILKDGELVEQYARDTVISVKNSPDAFADLWICACGTLNRDTENMCHSCKTGKEEVFASLDNGVLKANLEAHKEKLRLEAEQRQAERESEEKRQAQEAAIRAAQMERKANNTKKIAYISTVAIVTTVAFVFILNIFIIPKFNYKKAENLLNDGKFEEAIEIFEALNGFDNSSNKIKEAYYLIGIELFNLGRYKEALHYFVNSDDHNNSIEMMHNCIVLTKQVISAGNKPQTICIKNDGTVLFIGSNSDGSDVSSWKDIMEVSASSSFVVGLKTDGTVVATGNNDYGQCNVSGWSDIIAISAGVWQAVGLKADGTVVAVGDNKYGNINVSDWTNIVAISISGTHSVGLKKDGTVVAVGSNRYGQCKVSDWKDIIAISAGGTYTIGLKKDGTVVAVGNNERGQCDVSDWQNIIAVSASGVLTVGLKNDGTIVAVGDNEDGQRNVSHWNDIIEISTSGFHTVGIKSDGTVVAVGNNSHGQCNTQNWRDIATSNK